MNSILLPSEMADRPPVAAVSQLLGSLKDMLTASLTARLCEWPLRCHSAVSPSLRVLLTYCWCF